MRQKKEMREIFGDDPGGPGYCLESIVSACMSNTFGWAYKMTNIDNAQDFAEYMRTFLYKSDEELCKVFEDYQKREILMRADESKEQ